MSFSSAFNATEQTSLPDRAGRHQISPGSRPGDSWLSVSHSKLCTPKLRPVVLNLLDKDFRAKATSSCVARKKLVPKGWLGWSHPDVIFLLIFHFLRLGLVCHSSSHSSAIFKTQFVARSCPRYSRHSIQPRHGTALFPLRQDRCVLPLPSFRPPVVRFNEQVGDVSLRGITMN